MPSGSASGYKQGCPPTPQTSFLSSTQVPRTRAALRAMALPNWQSDGASGQSHAARHCRDRTRSLVTPVKIIIPDSESTARVREYRAGYRQDGIEQSIER